MLLLGLGMAIAATLVGFPQAGLGVVAGLPVGWLNYLLLASVMDRLPVDDPARAQAMLMGRAMGRLIIAMITLGAAALVGVEFLVGVALALTTQMLTYYLDAWQVWRRR